MANHDEKNSVPGQVVLPTMADEMGYEVIELKPAYERFCWEFVLRKENQAAAYKTIRPKVKDSTARVEAARILTIPAVQKRIAQIKAEQRRRFQVTADDLIEYHGKVIKIDRREFFTVSADGHLLPKSVDDISDEAASILEFDMQKTSDGGQCVLLRVPYRQQSASEMAKILGLHKERRELTGPDGGPIETDSRVNFYIPENERE